jgi:hypothetical protein
MRRALVILSLLAGSIGLAGCGGDDRLAEGGTSGTGISRGPVTSLGSIALNGRTLETTSAEVRVGGQPATLQEIEPGHVVRVRADFDAGEALVIELDPDVVGRVDATSIAAGTGTLTVLGQAVVVESATRVEGYNGAGAIAPGDRVRVSGLRSGDGDIVATRIEPAAGADDRLVGVMHSPGLAGADTLRMGGLTVDHSSAQILDFPGGSPTPGDRIAVSGRLSGAGILEAERIEPHEPVGAAPGESVEVTGILEGVAGSDAFAIEGVPLALGAATIEGGILADGTRVRVRGKLDEAGTLRAREVRVNP